MSTPPIDLVNPKMQMRGSTQARIFVADFLRSQLPTYLDFLGDWWGLDLAKLDEDEDRFYLPHPKEVSATEFEVNAVDEYPALCVVTGPGKVEHLEIDADSSDVYLTRYKTEIFGWLWGLEWDEVRVRCDDYMTATRFMLLDRPDLNVDPSGLVRVDDTTLEFSPSEIEATAVGFIAGFSIGFELIVYETILRKSPLREAPLGELIIANLDVEAVGLEVPIHPALE